MEVSSSVPILECGLGIVHQAVDDEEGGQERERALRDEEGAYSVEEESLSDHEVADHPTEVLVGVELEHAEAEDLLSVDPCDVDEADPRDEVAPLDEVAPRDEVAPQDDPLEGDALDPWGAEDLGYHACVEGQVWEHVGGREARGGEGEGDPSDWDSEGVE